MAQKLSDTLYNGNAYNMIKYPSFCPVLSIEVVINKGVIRKDKVIYRSITVMKEYEDISLEELRLADYNAGRKGTFIAEFKGFNDKELASAEAEEIVPGTGHTPFQPMVDHISMTRFQSITLMKQYKNKSFEELRYEDYLDDRKGVALYPCVCTRTHSTGNRHFENLATGSDFFSKMFSNCVAEPEAGTSFVMPEQPPQLIQLESLPCSSIDAFLTRSGPVQKPTTSSQDLRHVGRGDLLLNEYLVKVNGAKCYQNDPSNKMNLNIYAVMHIIGVDGSYILKDIKDTSDEITTLPLEKKKQVKLLSELSLKTIFSTNFIGNLSKKQNNLNNIKSGLVLELKDTGTLGDHKSDSVDDSGVTLTYSETSDNDRSFNNNNNLITKELEDIDEQKTNENCLSVANVIQNVEKNNSTDEAVENVDRNINVKYSSVASINKHVESNHSNDALFNDVRDENTNDIICDDRGVNKSVEDSIVYSTGVGFNHLVLPFVVGVVIGLSCYHLILNLL